MPTTSSGETVYADPDVMEEYVQTKANQFSIDASNAPPSDWRTFLERIQVRMKSRIDEYCGRDFEDHSNDTVTLHGGANGKRILDLVDAAGEPVRSVSEVRVDGEVVSTDEYVVDDGQLIRTEPPQVDAVDALARAGQTKHRPEWSEGYGNIAVDLDWGFQSPPGDVVEAELKLVAHTITGLSQLREGMIVQQDDVDVSVQLPEAMTPEVKELLRHHRQSGRTAGVI